MQLSLKKNRKKGGEWAISFFFFLVILAQSVKGQRSTRVFFFSFPFCSDFPLAIVFPT